MRNDPNNAESPATAFGCGLLLIGVVGGGFGAAALLGLSERIELEFFGIELNDTLGRCFWTAGCAVAVGIGLCLLRTRGASSDEPPS